MRYLSLFSGIEAATVAWEPLGWEPIAFSEVDKFPNAVLQHHYPDVPNLGDVTQHHTWSKDYAPNLIVGGSPCQAFSVAGLRQGLADERGNLTLTYLSVINQYQPQWLVWENVPGVLSVDGGRVFGSFLGALGELGYGFAYRVLDAQYFGVPQRRRRVFVVGCLGDWKRAAQVLFEPESLRGNPPPRRQAGQETPYPVAPSVTSSGPPYSRTGNERVEHEAVIPQPYQVGNCLTQRMYKGINTTLDEGQTPIVVPIHDKATRRNAGNGLGVGKPGEPSNTLTKGEKHAIAMHIRQDPISADEQSLPVEAKGAHGVVQDMAVRRLTPMECERLQGFPDNYTQIPYKAGRYNPDRYTPDDCPDTPRYKALGNSMAVPVMRWIGERINERN
jgi:DNA (cytosine-5)-methyltransferase 1